MTSKYYLQNDQKSSFGCHSLFNTSLGRKERKSISKIKHNGQSKQVTKIKLFSKLQSQPNFDQFRVDNKILPLPISFSSSNQFFQHEMRQAAKTPQFRNLYCRQSNKNSFQKLSQSNSIALQTPKFTTLTSDMQNMYAFSKRSSFIKSTVAFTSTRKMNIQSFAQNSQHSHERQCSIGSSKLSIQLQKNQSNHSSQRQFDFAKNSTEMFTNIGSPIPQNNHLLFPKQTDPAHQDFRKNKIQLEDIREVHTQFDESERSYSAKDRNVSQFSQIVSNDQNFLRKYTQVSFGVNQYSDI